MSGEEEQVSEATAVEAMESAQDSNSGKRGAKGSPAYDNIESQILSAMRSRVSYLREKADSFTFESVRRLLEEDLGLEKFALDVHKSFIKQHLVQCLEDANNDNASENSQEVEKKDVMPTKEATESPKGLESKKDVKEDVSEDEKMEDSPVMGLLAGAGEKPTKAGAKETQGDGKKEALESEIKKALRKRASYIKANSEKITMALLRRLLEKDLKLEKYTLDLYKNFISGQLDEVLESWEAPVHATKAKGRNLKKKSDSKASKKVSGEESSDASGSEADEEEEEMKVKKQTASKGKIQNSEGLKKRKREKETKESVKKRKKPAESDSQDDSDKADSEIVSDDGRSQSSAEKPVKKKEAPAPAPAYGKRVEHLKSVIKACGMSVPPSVYRKVKQAAEEKREVNLIKELEQILAKEGLSSNPSEKEIKEVKKRKERARELEGIDMSNIVSSSRRRAATSFAPPPKPKIPDESESDESEDSENDEEEEEQEEGEEDGHEEGDEESPSEESNEEDDAEEDD